ncbi:hypothetical protein [Nocardiopsis alborubida]|uniref:Uncharacterized protein n=1 Tax=Nocardiopsis alborubida TaxID=146802 RepID=A0A7X6RQN3_9ACTN|nr:hypothetical protein [Nocardiopsis alborubida]NKY99055.1 hypothetical protein [Nocardiopsis alborubida]
MTATGAPHTTTFQPEHREDMGNNNLAFHPDDPQTVYAGSCSEPGIPILWNLGGGEREELSCAEWE